MSSPPVSSVGRSLPTGVTPRAPVVPVEWPDSFGSGVLFLSLPSDPSLPLPGGLVTGFGGFPSVLDSCVLALASLSPACIAVDLLFRGDEEECVEESEKAGLFELVWSIISASDVLVGSVSSWYSVVDCRGLADPRCRLSVALTAELVVVDSLVENNARSSGVLTDGGTSCRAKHAVCRSKRRTILLVSSILGTAGGSIYLGRGGNATAAYGIGSRRRFRARIIWRR